MRRALIILAIVSVLGCTANPGQTTVPEQDSRATEMPDRAGYTEGTVRPPASATVPVDPVTSPTRPMPTVESSATPVPTYSLFEVFLPEIGVSIVRALNTTTALQAANAAMRSFWNTSDGVPALRGTISTDEIQNYAGGYLVQNDGTVVAEISTLLPGFEEVLTKYLAGEPAGSAPLLSPTSTPVAPDRTPSPTPTPSPVPMPDLTVSWGEPALLSYEDGVPQYTLSYQILNHGSKPVRDIQVVTLGLPVDVRTDPFTQVSGQLEGELVFPLDGAEVEYRFSASVTVAGSSFEPLTEELFIFEPGQLMVLEEIMDFFLSVQIGDRPGDQLGVDSVTWPRELGSPSYPLTVYLADQHVQRWGLEGMSAEALSLSGAYFAQWPSDFNIELVSDPSEAHIIGGAMEAHHQIFGLLFALQYFEDRQFEKAETQLDLALATHNPEADYVGLGEVRGRRAMLEGTLSAEYFSAVTGLTSEVRNGDFVGVTTSVAVPSMTYILTEFDVAQARIQRALGTGKSKQDLLDLIENGIILVVEPESQEGQDMMADGVYSKLLRPSPN